MKDRGRDGKSNKAFPLTPTLSLGESLGCPGRAECARACGRAGVVGLLGAELRCGGSELTFPEC